MKKLSFLALGDSYTIGELVEQKKSWPFLLAEKINKKGIPLEVSKVIATTGWTTDELLGAIEKENVNQKFDVVSLLIGVNNQYRNYPFGQYKKEYRKLLALAISFCKNGSAGVFCLSIPDYGVTPFAKEKNPSKIAEELEMYNHYAKSICRRNKVKFLDITPVSKLAKKDPEFTASDGLHPSASQYSMWVDIIFHKVFEMIKSLSFYTETVN